MKFTYLVVGIALVLVVGLGGLFLWYRSQNNPQVAGAQTSNGQFGRGGFRRGNFPAGSRPIFGQVASVSGSSFTVQSRRGGTLTIKITSSTQFTNGSQSDLASGVRVGGYGSPNSDGSINAQSLIINPSFGNFRSGGNGGSYNNSNSGQNSI